MSNKKSYYTKEQIRELLEDYILVPKSMIEKIPAGSHIRYLKKDKKTEQNPIETRFKPGGYVKEHFYTSDSDGNIYERFMRIKTRQNKGDNNYLEFSLKYKDIEKIWKKNTIPLEFEIIKQMINEKQNNR